MYRMYAADPRARINLGIRRRLAPLMENDRDRIKLMNSLLLSMPGSPIIYYGDEIGMGDNIYLGDRNGVRTPMQWSPDRNAGFSRADPQRLYLPPIMDPVYGYEAVNVEAQPREPSLAAQLDAAHARGAQDAARRSAAARCTFLRPGNRKVLAYLREYGDDAILCVANLCALGAAGRARPVALQGPRAGRDARPHAVPADRRAALPADAAGLRLLLVPPRHRRRGAALARGAARRARTCRCWCCSTAGRACSATASCRGASRMAEKTRAAVRARGAAALSSRRSAGTRAKGDAHRSARALADHVLWEARPDSWLLALLERRGRRRAPSALLRAAGARVGRRATRSACAALACAAVAKVRQQAQGRRARRRVRRRGVLPRAWSRRSAPGASLPTARGHAALPADARRSRSLPATDIARAAGAPAAGAEQQHRRHARRAAVPQGLPAAAPRHQPRARDRPLPHRGGALPALRAGRRRASNTTAADGTHADARAAAGVRRRTRATAGPTRSTTSSATSRTGAPRTTTPPPDVHGAYLALVQTLGTRTAELHLAFARAPAIPRSIPSR